MACAFARFVLLTPGRAVGSGVVVTGSLNYPWSAAPGAYGALQFLDSRGRSTLGYLSLMLASGFAACVEQVAIAMIGMFVPSMWRLDIAHD